MTEPLRYPKPATLTDMPPRSHFVIEASAGTGKTFLIEHRVVDLLLVEEIPAESLLVVTFTEKATAELSARIRALLDRIAHATTSCAPDVPHWTIDATARRKIEAALAGLERMSISTIHGFCHRLIGEHAFASGKQLRQDQIADVTAFDLAYRAVLREQLANSDDDRPYLVAWLDSGRSPASLRALLHKCTRERGPLSPAFDPGQLERAAEQVAAAWPGQLAAVTASLKAAGVHASTAKAAERRLRVVEELVQSSPGAARLLAALEGLGVGDVAALLASSSVEPRLGEALQALDDALVPLQAAVAARFAPKIAARIERDKHEHGLFDYDDMLGLLWRSLDGPHGDALARELRARFPYALIDEFQDTDELQWEIFKRIYLEHDAAEGPAFLSIVGDPKQAIYGFRGGDVYTYLRARRELVAAGARTVTLDENYRSTAELVDGFNAVFGPAQQPPFFSEGIDHQPVRSRSGLEARQRDGAVAAPFDVLVFESDESFKSADIKEWVRDVLVSELARVLGNGELVVGKAETFHSIRPRDCFVLTRSTGEAQEIADHLRKRAIPCALFQQEGLMHSRECAEVRDVLAAIANPRDRSARLRAWQTRFFAVRLAELPALMDLDGSHPLYARLFDWRQCADRLDYEQLFASIVDDSGFVERELLMAPSERALTNVLHLFELLLEEVTRSRCDIHELVRRVDAWIAEADLVPSADRNLQRLESDADAVQIMTIHKSKGLEAKVVFLYGGYGAPTGQGLHLFHDGDRRRVYVGSPPPAVKQRAAAELGAEDERLAYVALTRAAARVVLPLLSPGVMAKVSGYYGKINRRLLELRDDQHPAFRFRAAPSGGDDRASIADSAEIAPVLQRIPAPELPATPAFALSADRRGFQVTSYTRLKRAFESVVDDRAVSYDERVELAADDMPGGAQSGICIHELLERIDFDWIAGSATFEDWAKAPDCQRLFTDSLAKHGWPAHHVPAAQALVWRALRTPIATPELTLPPICQCPRNRRELEFLYPMPASAGYVRGFIDLVFEIGDRIYVLDWKTDVLRDYRSQTTARHVAANYRLQLDLYGIAIARLLGADAARRFGGMLYAFVRGMEESPTGTLGLYVEEADLARLDARYQRLTGGTHA